MDGTNGRKETTLGVNVFTYGRRAAQALPRSARLCPITSTLIFGEHDAVLVDAMMTAAEAEALANWVALCKLRFRETEFDFREENKMTTKGKVLVLVSSGHGLPLRDGKVYAGAGYYLNELTVPVRALMKEGYEITFANPKGNTPQLDVHSAVADFFGGDEARLQDYLKFRDSLTGLKNPTRISDVIASGLDQYDAVFVPGGHGPMMDLLDDPDAGTVMRHFHETSKPTAVLCHGPISLLSALPNSTEVVGALAAGDAAGARAKAQGWIYSGYKMTIFSTAEEQQREPLEIGGKVLFYPDFALRTAGGDVSVVAPWKSYVLQDRELISGQNPFSDEALLKLLLPALNGRRSEAAGAS
jgi:putative intracellular protease/amidase